MTLLVSLRQSFLKVDHFTVQSASLVAFLIRPRSPFARLPPVLRACVRPFSAPPSSFRLCFFHRPFYPHFKKVDRQSKRSYKKGRRLSLWITLFSLAQLTLAGSRALTPAAVPPKSAKQSTRLSSDIGRLALLAISGHFKRTNGSRRPSD